MNRSRYLLPALLAISLALGACSKTEETSTSSKPVASADQVKRAPTVEIVASEGKGFTVGSIMSTTVVYVFFDPQCPHCGHLWNASVPLQKKAKFVWLPVGLMNSTSSAQGATLLTAADPAQAMTEHEASLLAGSGGIGAGSNLTDEAKQSIAANTKLFNNLGLEGVPFTIVKNARPGQMVTRGGSMETPALAELIGVDVP